MPRLNGSHSPFVEGSTFGIRMTSLPASASARRPRGRKRRSTFGIRMTSLPAPSLPEADGRRLIGKRMPTVGIISPLDELENGAPPLDPVPVGRNPFDAGMQERPATQSRPGISRNSDLGGGRAGGGMPSARIPPRNVPCGYQQLTTLKRALELLPKGVEKVRVHMDKERGLVDDHGRERRSGAGEGDSREKRMRKHPSEVFEGEREGGLFSKTPPSQAPKESGGGAGGRAFGGALKASERRGRGTS